MSYCPKCGNKVDETMAFCSSCGAALKGATPSQAAPAQSYQRYEKAEKNEKQEKQEKQEKNEHPEKGEKQEKGEYGFVGLLIGGLVLIIFGLFSLLRFSGYLTNGQGWAIMLLLIGIIIIVGAVYVAVISRKHFPEPS